MHIFSAVQLLATHLVNGPYAVGKLQSGGVLLMLVAAQDASHLPKMLKRALLPLFKGFRNKHIILHCCFDSLRPHIKQTISCSEFSDDGGRNTRRQNDMKPLKGLA